jgi:hypothetical protein
MAGNPDLKLGYRVFVIDGNAVAHISQKTFEDFYFRERPSLPQFAGRLVLVAMVFYALKGRKPDHIVRIDTMRTRITFQGSVDLMHRQEALHIAATALARNAAPKSSEDGNVVDARRLFERRRREVHSPNLPGPVHRNILEQLFS